MGVGCIIILGEYVKLIIISREEIDEIVPGMTLFCFLFLSVDLFWSLSGGGDYIVWRPAFGTGDVQIQIRDWNIERDGAPMRAHFQVNGSASSHQSLPIIGPIQGLQKQKIVPIF